MKDLSDRQRRSVIEFVKEHGGFIGASSLKEMGYRQSNSRVIWMRRFGSPAFQFRDSKLIEIVGKVNRVLSEAGHESFAVTHWWITPDDQSGKAPIELLNRPNELWKAVQQRKR